MNIDRNTKLKDLMEAYPWLVDEAVKIEPKLKILNNPIGKAFLKKATVADLSEKSGLSEEEIIGRIREFIDKH